MEYGNICNEEIQFNQIFAAEVHYVDGKLHGIRKEWHDNKHHTLANENPYVNGERDGWCREWYNDNQHTLKCEAHYTDGILDGSWKRFDRNGNIMLGEDYTYTFEYQ